MNQSKIASKSIILFNLGITIIAFLVFIWMVLNTFENLDANKIMCIQSPISGKLTWHTSAGVKWQGFGRVTKYDKRSIYKFSHQVRFNDAGHAVLSGSVQFDMPMDNDVVNGMGGGGGFGLGAGAVGMAGAGSGVLAATEAYLLGTGLGMVGFAGSSALGMYFAGQAAYKNFIKNEAASGKYSPEQMNAFVSAGLLDKQVIEKVDFNKKSMMAARYNMSSEQFDSANNKVMENLSGEMAKAMGR